MLGSRGARSRSSPVRPPAAGAEPPPAPAPAPRAPPAPHVCGWIGPLAVIALGWLVANRLSTGGGLGGSGAGLVLAQLLLGGVVFLFVTLLRSRRAARARAVCRVVATPSPVVDSPPQATTAERPDDSNLEDGIRDIRRMDPRFDPARFTGYIEMVFRNAHGARMSRDIASLRDRVTPELYGELQARCARLRSRGHASHVDQIEIRARVTEAWHEDGRDYLTAYIIGTMLDYAVDEGTGALVDGSRTTPRDVEAFWTFTRPAGLNPWMLSAIQTS